MMMRFLVAVLLTFACSLTQGKEAVPAAEDPVLEARVMTLAEQLRCLVCQNQTIADSHASLAVDLRNEIRDQLRHGRSDREVMDFMVQRYGDFVLYRPPVKTTTWLLWFGPALFLAGGFVALVATVARQRRQGGTDALTSAERARVDALLRGDTGAGAP